VLAGGVFVAALGGTVAAVVSASDSEPTFLAWGRIPDAACVGEYLYSEDVTHKTCEYMLASAGAVTEIELKLDSAVTPARRCMAYRTCNVQHAPGVTVRHAESIGDAAQPRDAPSPREYVVAPGSVCDGDRLGDPRGHFTTGDLSFRKSCACACDEAGAACAGFAFVTLPGGETDEDGESYCQLYKSCTAAATSPDSPYTTAVAAVKAQPSDDVMADTECDGEILKQVYGRGAEVCLALCDSVAGCLAVAEVLPDQGFDSAYRCIAYKSCTPRARRRASLRSRVFARGALPPRISAPVAVAAPSVFVREMSSCTGAVISRRAISPGEPCGCTGGGCAAAALEPGLFGRPTCVEYEQCALGAGAGAVFVADSSRVTGSPLAGGKGVPKEAVAAGGTVAIGVTCANLDEVTLATRPDTPGDACAALCRTTPGCVAAVETITRTGVARCAAARSCARVPKVTAYAWVYSTL